MQNQNEGQERTLILVKALPHVGQGHGEIVCCAGLTLQRQWRRLFPVRFRHLKDKKFERWQWIEYRWRKPNSDNRPESRRVFEESIKPKGQISRNEREEFLTPLIVGSATEAAASGNTLALVRPRNIRFSWKKKSADDIEDERSAYAYAANQKSFFDDELKALEPCPYHFLYRYETDDGRHNNSCEDWETTAMFFNFRNRYSEQEALKMMHETFNERYPQEGVAFALGTHSRFPQTWLLVGVIRLNESDQTSLRI